MSAIPGSTVCIVQCLLYELTDTDFWRELWIHVTGESLLTGVKDSLEYIEYLVNNVSFYNATCLKVMRAPMTGYCESHILY